MKIKEATRALAALAQDSRLEVFRLLVVAGSAGLSAGEIAKSLDIPAATLSFHLNQLSNAGLIESERRSRSLIYSLQTNGVRELFSFLLADCCQGNPELCGDLLVEVCC